MSEWRTLTPAILERAGSKVPAKGTGSYGMHGGTSGTKITEADSSLNTGKNSNLHSKESKPGAAADGIKHQHPAEGVKAIQALFGGAVRTNNLNKVRSNSNNTKNCIRSKLGRCVIHRCNFLEVSKQVALFEKSSDGKRVLVKREVKEWKSEKSEKTMRKRDSGSNSVSGGNLMGERLSEDCLQKNSETQQTAAAAPAVRGQLGSAK